MPLIKNNNPKYKQQNKLAVKIDDMLYAPTRAQMWSAFGGGAAVGLVIVVTIFRKFVTKG